MATQVTGITANPMIQAEASKLALFTSASYAWNPTAYDPRAAFLASVRDFTADATAPGSTSRLPSASSRRTTTPPSWTPPSPRPSPRSSRRSRRPTGAAKGLDKAARTLTAYFTAMAATPADLRANLGNSTLPDRDFDLARQAGRVRRGGQNRRTADARADERRHGRRIHPLRPPPVPAQATRLGPPADRPRRTGPLPLRRDPASGPRPGPGRVLHPHVPVPHPRRQHHRHPHHRRQPLHHPQYNDLEHQGSRRPDRHPVQRDGHRPGGRQGHHDRHLHGDTRNRRGRKVGRCHGRWAGKPSNSRTDNGRRRSRARPDRQLQWRVGQFGGPGLRYVDGDPRRQQPGGGRGQRRTAVPPMRRTRVRTR